MTRTYTAEELMEFPSDWHFELINGRLRPLNAPETPETIGVSAFPPQDLAMHTGFEHGFLPALPFLFEDNGLGAGCAAKTGFLLTRDPDVIKAPDFAFVAQARLPESRVRGYLPIVPDLVLETRSPSDRNTAALQKIGEWLDFGVRMVLYLNPQSQTLIVYRPDAPPEVLGPPDTLAGGEVLPGFRLPMSRLFTENME